MINCFFFKTIHHFDYRIAQDVKIIVSTLKHSFIYAKIQSCLRNHPQTPSSLWKKYRVSGAASQVHRRSQRPRRKKSPLQKTPHYSFVWRVRSIEIENFLFLVDGRGGGGACVWRNRHKCTGNWAWVGRSIWIKAQVGSCVLGFKITSFTWIYNGSLSFREKTGVECVKLKRRSIALIIGLKQFNPTNWGRRVVRYSCMIRLEN